MAGGRRVWGAWLLFVVCAAPAALTYRTPHHTNNTATPAIDQRYHYDVPLRYRDAPLRFISTATTDSLCLLPGIGPVLAARIVSARNALGPFRSWNDLRRRVPGIGPRSVSRLREAREPLADPVGYWLDHERPAID